MPISFISGKEIKDFESVKGSDIKDSIYNLIKRDYPDITVDSIISIDDMNHYRRIYLSNLVSKNLHNVLDEELNVLNAIKENSVISEFKELDQEEDLTFGQKMADKVAEFGGSWTFIIAFFSFLLLWIAVNVVVLISRPFDPYPFILLNLILSCLAAIQAPIIMMSQNRQDEKDRSRAQLDYQVNLKAELEIKLLNEKIDYLLMYQNKRLLEFQEVQMEYLEDLYQRIIFNNKSDKEENNDDITK
jgi:uncharacterized membrane protein